MCDSTEEIRVSAFSNDGLLEYTEATKGAFESDVLHKLRNLFSECHAVKKYACDTPELSKNHMELVKSIGNIVSKVWTTLQKAERFNTRLDDQTRRLKEKLAMTVPKQCLKKPKSTKRQDAGKVKVASLRSWQAETLAAIKALRESGYTGSVRVKKGMPVYAKIFELREAKRAAESTAASTASPSHPFSAPIF